MLSMIPLTMAQTWMSARTHDCRNYEGEAGDLDTPVTLESPRPCIAAW